MAIKDLSTGAGQIFDSVTLAEGMLRWHWKRLGGEQGIEGGFKIVYASQHGNEKHEELVPGTSLNWELESGLMAKVTFISDKKRPARKLGIIMETDAPNEVGEQSSHKMFEFHPVSKDKKVVLSRTWEGYPLAKNKMGKKYLVFTEERMV